MITQNIKNVIPENIPDDARVWVYQSSRAFIEKEIAEINEQLNQFYTQWQSHGSPVDGWAGLLYGQFIVVIADESDVSVGGCSTDSSVRVIKSIERQYDVNFFDRMMLTFLVKDKAEMLPFGQVQYAIDKGFIDGNTLVFNNVVSDKRDLLNKWLVPLKESWLTSRVELKENA